MNEKESTNIVYALNDESGRRMKVAQHVEADNYRGKKLTTSH